MYWFGTENFVIVTIYFSVKIHLPKFVDSLAYQRNPIIRYSAFSGMKPAALPSGVNQSI